MADSVRVTNMPDSGSRERVALDLTKMIIHHAEVYSLGAYKDKAAILSLYSECLVATHGSWNGGQD